MATFGFYSGQTSSATVLNDFVRIFGGGNYPITSMSGGGTTGFTASVVSSGGSLTPGDYNLSYTYDNMLGQHTDPSGEIPVTIAPGSNANSIQFTVPAFPDNAETATVSIQAGTGQFVQAVTVSGTSGVIQAYPLAAPLQSTYNETLGYYPELSNEGEDSITWNLLDMTVASGGEVVNGNAVPAGSIMSADFSAVAVLPTGTSTITSGTISPSFIKTFYVRFTNNFDFRSMTVQLLDGYDAQTGTFSYEGPNVDYAWLTTDIQPARSLTSPVQYWMNVNNNRIVMVLQGDPTISFTDFLRSPLYVGSIQPFMGCCSNEVDIDGNAALTAGSAGSLSTDKTWGDYESHGNDSIMMLKTQSGVYFQAHYASIITQSQNLQLAQNGFNASAWTGQYHMSPIYVIHPVDGYRGSFDSVLAVTKNNILHLDQFTIDTSQDTTKAWQSETYQYFDTNAPNSFIENSANSNTGIAFLQTVTY